LIAPAKPFSILDHTGSPLPRATQRLPAMSQQPIPRKPVEARYDAAQDTPEFTNYWAAADGLDSDSANSKAVREKLVKRSRYEVGNNGFMDGMVQTHANYLVGTGPKLRMLTGSPGFNQTVESLWKRWAKAVKLRRKLWCMAHAKVQDGEAFGIMRRNPGLRERVKWDFVLFETEMCQTPMLRQGVVGYIDGLKTDEFGNVEHYDILPQHPGGQWTMFAQKPEQVSPLYVAHWFTLRRPGQHRAVPEFRSTLNTGASSRRWREATVSAAETAADIALTIATENQPDGEFSPVADYTTDVLKRRTVMALPAGYMPNQIKAEHPNATYEAFSKGQLNEQARPKSMPYNLAACDSSSYNYASGRLDHQTYFLTLDLEREDANDLVLDETVFPRWWEAAVLAYGWNADGAEVPDHAWDWPKHPVADAGTEADARDKNLKNGSLSPSEDAANDGEDFEERIVKLAADYGKPVDEMREILLKNNFAQAFINAGAAANQPAAKTPLKQGAAANG
jgi:capsid protein